MRNPFYLHKKTQLSELYEKSDPDNFPIIVVNIEKFAFTFGRNSTFSINT